MSSNITKRKKLKGTAAVEFAFVFPIFIAVMFAIVAFSVYFYDRIILINAAREGARYGIVLIDPKRNSSDIQTVAINNCTGMIDFSSTNPSCTASVAGAQGISGTPLTVTMQYILTVPVIFPNGKAMKATITMLHE